MTLAVDPPGLLSPWLLEPVPIALAAVAAACFGRGFLRLRRRGRRDHAPWTRAVLFGSGLALFLVPLVSRVFARGQVVPFQYECDDWQF